MFFDCHKLKDIMCLQEWNVSSAEYMTFMFPKSVQRTNGSLPARWNIHNADIASLIFCDS